MFFLCENRNSPLLQSCFALPSLFVTYFGLGLYNWFDSFLKSRHFSYRHPRFDEWTIEFKSRGENLLVLVQSFIMRGLKLASPFLSWRIWYSLLHCKISSRDTALCPRPLLDHHQHRHLRLLNGLLERHFIRHRPPHLSPLFHHRDYQLELPFLNIE